MASTGFTGIYKLQRTTIDRVVTQTSAGTYVLTKKYNEQAFYVDYVGRSDTDLNARLKTWANENKYSHFKFGYNTSAMAAFEKECNLYHDFNASDNISHPARLNNSNWKCPRCNVF